MSRIKFIICIPIIILFFIPAHLYSQQQNHFPYTLKKIDYMIFGVGITSALYAEWMHDNQPKLTIEELEHLDRYDINGFDRSATYNWNQNLDEISDWTRAVIIAAPSLLILNQGIKEEWRNVFTYGIMYAEVALLTVGFTGLTKSIVMRKRPFLYNTDINLSDKQSIILNNDSFDSFFSGHTSSAFASAVFLSKTYTDIYGRNTLGKIIWGTSLTIASLTGYLRYKSGYHYPTDILAGAMVGSAIGYIIPLLHKRNAVKSNLSYGIEMNSLRVRYCF